MVAKTFDSLLILIAPFQQHAVHVLWCACPKNFWLACTENKSPFCGSPKRVLKAFQMFEFDGGACAVVSLKQRPGIFNVWQNFTCDMSKLFFRINSGTVCLRIYILNTKNCSHCLIWTRYILPFQHWFCENNVPWIWPAKELFILAIVLRRLSLKLWFLSFVLKHSIFIPLMQFLFIEKKRTSRRQDIPWQSIG